MLMIKYQQRVLVVYMSTEPLPIRSEKLDVDNNSEFMLTEWVSLGENTLVWIDKDYATDRKKTSPTP